MIKAIVAILVVTAVWFTPRVEAQVRYVDENGVAHWVGSPDQIPAQYRGRVDTPDLPRVDTSQGMTDEERARREALREGYMQEQAQKQALEKRRRDAQEAGANRERHFERTWAECSKKIDSIVVQNDLSVAAGKGNTDEYVRCAEVRGELNQKQRERVRESLK